AATRATDRADGGGRIGDHSRGRSALCWRAGIYRRSPPTAESGIARCAVADQIGWKYCRSGGGIATAICDERSRTALLLWRRERIERLQQAQGRAGQRSRLAARD